jgi:hypothetical protein
MTEPPFVPGLLLCELFYEEAVRPILETDFPGLAHSAALIGNGSEVLGFDTAMSRDHDWGPRLLLFLEEAELAAVGERMREVLGNKLPFRFRGYATGFGAHSSGAGVPLDAERRPIPHRVQIDSIAGYLERYLGWNPARELTPADWLTFPQQKLRSLTARAVYHDGVGLGVIRERLATYPRDVWLYLLAAQWGRLGEAEHLVGRAGFVGDELGATILAARLVRDLMALCFLMEQVYAPYPKWVGTAFAQLACAPRMTPLLRAIQAAANWEERDGALAAAYAAVAEQHRALGITRELPVAPSDFYGRPFHVIWGGTYAAALLAEIEDEEVRAIAANGPLGSIDQISDHTQLLTDPVWRPVLVQLYDGKTEGAG